MRHRSDLIRNLLRHGINYDGIDFIALNRLARVNRGELAAGDGNYSIIILPNLVGINLEALEKIAAFCRSGGAVLVTRRIPERAYGLNQPLAKNRLTRLLEELFGRAPDAEHAWSRAYGRGRVVYVPNETNALNVALSDFTGDPRLDPPQAEVGFVHRRDRQHDFYFLANVGANACAFEADFNSSHRQAALWDPLNGNIHALASSETPDGYRRVRLDLPPRGSIFVVFEAVVRESAELAGQSRLEELRLNWQLSFDESSGPPTRTLNPYRGHGGQIPSIIPAARPMPGLSLGTDQFRNVLGWRSRKFMPWRTSH